MLATLLLPSPRAAANVVGADTQNFNPITSGLDFVTVQSSETLKPGIFNLGFFLNYAVNTLPYMESNNNQSHTNFNDSLLGADLNIGLGLLNNWDVGVSFPQIISQSVDSDTGARGQFAATGLTEIRLNSKYRLFGDDNGGLALVASTNMNQTQNNPFTGINAGPIINLEVAGDQTFGLITVGANVGYRWRSPGEPIAGIGIEPFGDQIIASVAANYLIQEWDTKAIVELFGGLPAQTTDYNTDRKQSSLELLGGLKHDFSPHLAGHAGAGTELIHGNSSPDWRVYVGLNYTFGPVFSREPDTRREPMPDQLHHAEADPFAGLPQAPIETFVVRDVLFKFDSDELEEGSKDTLDKLAVYLMKPPAFKHLDITGHTDSIGAAGYNLNLSQRRARTVKRYLAGRHGFSDNQISAFGYGETQPIADNGNYQGRALNRRVEFRVAREFNQETSKSPPVEEIRRDPNDPGGLMKITPVSGKAPSLKAPRKAPAKPKR